MSAARFAIALLMMHLVLGVPEPLVNQVTATPSSDPSVGAESPVIVFYPEGQPQGGLFDVELDPGEAASLAVVLANGGSQPFDTITYVADAFTVRNGGFGVRDSRAPKSGPTLWIDYPTDTFSIGPAEELRRELTITVPEGTKPGEYVAGIAMETADPVNEPSEEGMFRINQFYRTVIGIRIVVPGELAPKLELGDPALVREGVVDGIVVPVSNTGNAKTEPSGQIEVFDRDGNIVLSAPIEMGRIYGGHETEIWVGLSSPLPAGHYSVSVELSDAERGIYASLESAPLVSAASATPEAPAPISITSSTASAMPSAEDIQFVNVEAVITNRANPVANAQLSLIARVDGEEVERFPISQSLSLPEGETTVTTRYIPVTGWTSGEWTFELLLETIEPSGAAVVVASQPIEGTITVP